METIRVSMTQLHHHLSDYIEMARAGNVVEVYNYLKGRVECHLIAPTLTYPVKADGTISVSATSGEGNDES